MVTPSRSLVAVHAHPDDECLGGGGALARYSSAGVHVCVVTCTNGELGEIAEIPGLGPPDTLRERLGEIRIRELHDACRILGVEDVRLLGYHDSGMEGTDGNLAAHAFVNQDIREPAERVARVFRELRPQVVVTYNEYGFYGHPDHIQAHRVTLAALDIAADPDAVPDAGPPHDVAKLYYTAVPKSMLRAARQFFSEGDDGAERFSEEEVERIGTEDELITVTLDVSPFIDRKFAALEAHQTQRGTTAPFLEMPQDVRNLAFASEHFVRARPPSRAGEREADLFDGLT